MARLTTSALIHKSTVADKTSQEAYAREYALCIAAGMDDEMANLYAFDVAADAFDTAFFA